MTFRQSIKDQLITNRPSLSGSSISTYTSTLANILTKIPGINQNKLNVDMFDKQHKKIMKFMEDFSSSKRKSILSALYIISNNAIYNTKMKADMSVVYEEYKTQEKTEKEQNNWIEWTDVLKLHDKLTDVADKLLRKIRINDREFNVLNSYILLSVYVLIPPRRIQDFKMMKIRNYDGETDNHYDGENLTFHNYKTSNVYGSQSINISESPLQVLLDMWIDINDDCDYLIVSEKDHSKKLEGSMLTKMLNKIFDSKVSASMLRKSFLSHTYRDIDLLKMENLALKMGHSSSTALGKYVKK